MLALAKVPVTSPHAREKTDKIVDFIICGIVLEAYAETIF